VVKIQSVTAENGQGKEETTAAEYNGLPITTYGRPELGSVLKSSPCAFWKLQLKIWY